MASKKTWIWIIVGVIGTCVLALFALAGAGVYFVSRHINAERVTSAEASRQFDATLATFKNPRALIEMDGFDRPHAARPLSEVPTSADKPESLWVLAWNPDRDRLVKVSLPFWVLRFGGRKMDIMASGDRSLDLDRLNLDVPELERIGPTIVLDYRGRSGEHVLVWTR
jgi:hypothetical protein